MSSVARFEARTQGMYEEIARLFAATGAVANT